METTHQSLVEWLPGFFQQWSENALTFNEPTTTEKIDIDVGQLMTFFSRLSTPLQAVQPRVLSFDPWDVAGLKRKEVRNSAVLAWLLNPQGSHGFGTVPLYALLASIRTAENQTFPAAFTRFCRVRVESNPNGDSKNRVDIEIDADNFFVLIEVKIDAFEQKEQIERYCLEAEKRATKKRRWGVVFLTPQGRQPKSMRANNPHVISCLSWNDLATRFEEPMRADYRKTGAVHDSASMRQMAAHSAFCFLERMRKF
ncbi:PD-(D/E)XK nuclease family protein [Candidatus Symbiopectobacterium sp. NZEC127]|uniref:PDDEXK-like family protein n=1 Tax=Candidatus Symbiopectobacterium sp. NZEC127 TaxID=2820472 RepID=UPI002227ECB5|nr:PD-(D/E)XK nuclease family protein [Candidatus Symbiopectobacterium sp. NZEC127]MCW2488506.1 PD-(D/E)XK nuclease family protein [Candidatus Symbiopectobacterium sp. NZEC127]